MTVKDIDEKKNELENDEKEKMEISPDDFMRYLDNLEKPLKTEGVEKENKFCEKLSENKNIEDHKSKYGDRKFNNGVREWFNEKAGDIVKKVGDKIPILEDDTKKVAYDLANNMDVIKEKGVTQSESEKFNDEKSKYGDRKFDSEVRGFINQAAGDVVKYVGNAVPFIPEHKKQEFYDKVNNIDIIKEKGVRNNEINELNKNSAQSHNIDEINKKIAEARDIFENSTDAPKVKPFIKAGEIDEPEMEK